LRSPAFTFLPLVVLVSPLFILVMLGTFILDKIDKDDEELKNIEEEFDEVGPSKLDQQLEEIEV